MTKKIVIHSKVQCPFCVKTKDFLEHKSIPFDTIIYDPHQNDYNTQKEALISRTNHHTFPQIFIGNQFIGGYSDLLHIYHTYKFHDLCQDELGLVLERNYDF
jgi:glutaredoxin 3